MGAWLQRDIGRGPGGIRPRLRQGHRFCMRSSAVGSDPATNATAIQNNDTPDGRI